MAYLRGLSRLVVNSFGVAACSLALVVASPASAQEIDPLNVEADPNGVDLLKGQVYRQMPTLAIPAAPALTFQNISDFMPVLEGRVPSGGQTWQTSYRINGGRLVSDFIACADSCGIPNGRGSTVVGGQTVGPFTYTEGGSGRKITFDLLYGDQNAPSGNNNSFYYVASSVANPGGETLAFTYDTAYTIPGLNYLAYRPATVTSSYGYQLRFNYQSNDPLDGTWRTLQKAEIVATSAPSVVLASLEYSNTSPTVTITDIAGRQFDCLYCQNELTDPGVGLTAEYTLPTESSPSFEASATHTSTGHILHLTRDGVTYDYTAVDDTFGYGSIQDLTITAPNGFYRYVDVTNIPMTSGICHPSNHAYCTALPPRSRIDSITNSENGTTYYTYDSQQRVDSITYPEGNSISVDYDLGGNIISMVQTSKNGVDQISQSANYSWYLECAELTCFLPNYTIDGRGNQTDYTWSNVHGGLLTQLDPVDANGQRRKVKNTYDTSGRLITEEICATDASGTELTCGTANSFVRQITYQGATLLPLTETVTDGVGNGPITTTYTYDEHGNVLSQDGPLTGTDDATYFQYDPLGRRIWEIGPRNEAGTRAATRTTYRVADDQVELVESGYVPGTLVGGTGDIANFTNVREVETAYNSRRLAIQVETRENGVATPEMVAQTSYDALNRAECSAVRMNPAAYGSLPTDACALGTAGASGEDRVTRTVYDSEGRTLEIEQAVGTTLERTYATYEYSANGQMTAMTDARGYRAEMVYDGFDRQTHWYFPSPTQTGVINSADYEQYTYDANGNRTSLRRRDGSTLTFTYDNLGRMTVKTVPDRAGLDAMFERDVFYTYDIRGLQTQALFSQVGTSTPSTEGLTTTYDRYGRITDNTMTMDGVTRSLGYGYDVAGNRTSITMPDAVSYTYEYTSGGFFNKLRAPYGSPLVDFNYNQRGEVTGLVRLGTAPDQDLTYDEFGRLASSGWTQGGAQAATWSFTRNPASQIATEALSNPLYSWDAHPTGVTTANYTTNGLNQYTDVGSNDLCHDANGNLTADGNSNDGGWVYLYDIENRLVQMRARTDFTNCPTNTTGYTGALAAQLEYDPMGRLYEVRGYNAGALQSTTRMLYDGDALVAEYNTAGTMLARYVHGPAAGVDDPLISYAGSSTSAANVRYLYSDARGSVVLTTNEAHSVPTVNTYDPYGLPGTTNTGRFQYTGQVWLEELGLYYYKARMYSPTLGRFMQTDPIGYEDNINLYAYVANDPINGVDPSGETTFNCQGVTNPDGETAISCDEVDDGSWSVTVNFEHRRQRIVEGTGEFVEETDHFSETVSPSARVFMTDEGVAENLLSAWTSRDVNFDAPVDALAHSDIMASDGSNWGALGGNGAPRAGNGGHGNLPRNLGNLANRAGERAADVARSRGASGSNINQMGHWANRTLGDVARAAANGDRSAATALKIVKQAGRLGQRY